MGLSCGTGRNLTRRHQHTFDRDGALIGPRHHIQIPLGGPAYDVVVPDVGGNHCYELVRSPAGI